MKPAERLRQLRSELRMTQPQVAKAIGVPAHIYISWECGTTPSTRELQCKVAVFYGVPVADVSVMLQQIMYLTNTHDAVRERIGFKINRQLERIAAEVNNEQPNN